MVLAKIMKSLYFFFLGKICQKKVFGNVLDRKLAFLDHKNMDSKNSRKIGNFRKGLVHCFGQTYEISLFLLFRQNMPKKSVW